MGGQSTIDCFEQPEEEAPPPASLPNGCTTYGSIPATIVLTNTNSQSLNTQTLLNQIVHINGEFLVNSNFAFFGCKVKMAPGAKIRTVNGKSLMIFDSHLYACSSMWVGVEVGEGSYCGAFHSIIEDAQFGILTKPTTLIDLYYSTFNRNWVGFKAEGTFTLNYFTKNVFTHVGPVLNGTFSGQVPTPQGTRSFVGMWFEGGGEIDMEPTSEAELNRFSTINIGILSKRLLRINKSCYFGGISQQGSNGVINGLQTGVGILVQGLFGAVDFDGFYSTVSFYKCSAGIRAENNASCNVEYTQFDRVGKCIWGVEPRVIFGTNNLFKLSLGGSHGMLVNSNNGGLIFSIDKSIFTQTGNNSNIGIEVTGADVVPSLFLIHEDNTFNLYGDKTGIKLMNVKGQQIDQIQVVDQIFNLYQQNNQSPTAATFTNCLFGRVQANYVNSNTTTVQARGLLFEETNLTCIRQNHLMEKFTQAMGFTGTCTGSQINCNNFCGDQTSLLVNGTIDPQDFKGNVFFGDTEAKNNSPAFGLMKFKVDTENGVDPEFMPSTPDPLGWFENIDDMGAQLDCAFSCGYPWNPTFPCVIPAMSSLDGAIAAGTAFGTNADPVVVWNANRALYRKLIEDPGSRPAGSNFANFYNTQASTAIGSFAQVEKAIQNLLSVSASDELALTGLLDQLATKSDELEVLMTSLNQLSDPFSNPTLLANIATAQNETSTIGNSIASLQNSIIANQTAGASAVAAMNNALVASNAFQTYERQVNEIQLAWIASGLAPLSSAQTETLKGIASLCPGVAGRAVYKAAAMLSPCEKEVAEQNWLNCIGLRSEELSGEESATKTIEVYPNPANQVIYLRLPLSAYEEGTVVLTNMYGQLVRTTKFEGQQQVLAIPVAELPGGIYAISVVLDGATIHTGLFSVSH